MSEVTKVKTRGEVIDDVVKFYSGIASAVLVGVADIAFSHYKSNKKVRSMTLAAKDAAKSE